MSTPSSSAMSTAASQPGCLDPLDSFTDFSEYETVPYHSPSMSPSNAKGKASQFSKPVSNTPATLPSNQPTLSGPSHQYDLYRQQTGIPQGAVANTLAVNSSNLHVSQYGFDGYALSPSDDFVDFGDAPRQTPYEMDMEYESPSSEPAFFFPDQPVQKQEFVDPSAIRTHPPVANVLPTQSSNVGRLWPGMHQQQAALAKAQAQQKQQQQIIQQQRQSPVTGKRAKASHPPTDAIVEEKISQLLSSMRQSSVATDDDTTNGNAMSQIPRMRKEEDEMDEDERLLAKYIGQLEGEIAAKVNENTDLKSQNKALLEENTRLSDLTRMLLSSPSFSGFLDNLSSNPAQQSTSTPVHSQPEQRVRKDVNPYTAQQQMQTQHIGMAMVPEQNMDFGMLDLNSEGQYTYQPQVFSVLSMPETIIDTSVLSGKPSSYAKFESEDEKVELPAVERMPVPSSEKSAPAAVVVDDEFDADPKFALFADSPPIASPHSSIEIDPAAFLSITPEKSGFELVVAPSNHDATSDAVTARLLRMCENMEATIKRLEDLTINF
ncbi:hypothetical protein B7494_g2582 [Chlorociboria aeruginascens]|nr:hypothetical protein B7494_g2582 [Chlorociboria aeruginascens]